MIPRPVQRQAGQRPRFDARGSQSFDCRPIGGAAFETGDELDAARRHFDREHLAQMALQSCNEVVAARVIEPAHPAQMREEMPVGDELGQRFLDVARGNQPDVPLRDFQRADQCRRDDEIAESDIRCHHLREGTDIEHAAMGIEALQGRHRPAVIVEFAVIIVLHDPGLAGHAQAEKFGAARQ
ncbi:hypothetical protein XI03_15755 [Bradyrhizobium sp. CCBAU 65884]|nr:hypothetical protein [Bradyrhizobium sp. CCBAU 65884]